MFTFFQPAGCARCKSGAASDEAGTRACEPALRHDRGWGHGARRRGRRRTRRRGCGDDRGGRAGRRRQARRVRHRALRGGERTVGHRRRRLGRDARGIDVRRPGPDVARCRRGRRGRRAPLRRGGSRAHRCRRGRARWARPQRVGAGSGRGGGWRGRGARDLRPSARRHEGKCQGRGREGRAREGTEVHHGVTVIELVYVE